jgi:hypothetical protein
MGHRGRGKARRSTPRPDASRSLSPLHMVFSDDFSDPSSGWRVVSQAMPTSRVRYRTLGRRSSRFLTLPNA